MNDNGEEIGDCNKISGYRIWKSELANFFGIRASHKRFTRTKDSGYGFHIKTLVP